jgi:hypothetical protein
MEIAEPALAVLDIGLDNITAVAHSFVPGSRSAAWRRHSRERAGDDLPEITMASSLRTLSPQRASISGPDGDILLCRRDDRQACGPIGRP